MEGSVEAGDSLVQGLDHVVLMVVCIFDSALTMLGEPSEGGVMMPAPAYVACLRRLLHSLDVDITDDDDVLIN
jgi:hypothetical protein